ncbi:MAG: SsrA-binding protein SmpB [Acidimicrobiales bacterium]|nr:SsrA-binding protein SmpB [Acidimicrobiales bacterium]
MGQEIDQRPSDRESAESRIEHRDGSRIHVERIPLNAGLPTDRERDGPGTLDEVAKAKKKQAARKAAVSQSKVVATNRQARRNFEILDTFEAGLVLQGSEVKSLREAKVQLADAFARVDDGEAWLLGLHIAPYSKTATAAFGHDPDRRRKLLLHRAEIERLGHRMAAEGLTLVPLSLYFSNGRAKIELALARGKNVLDKRRTIADRQSERDAARAIADSRRQ